MIYQNKYFKVIFPKEIQDYVLECISDAENKRKLYCQLFDTDGEEIGKVKVHYFTTRKAFVDFIQTHNEYGENYVPPIWATGCFADGGIQILVNPNNEQSLNKKRLTISHELLHLFFNKYIYQKYNLPRIRWLDESFACSLEKGQFSDDKDNFFKLAKQLLPMKDFDLNLLNDRNLIKPADNSYDGYQMFHLVGEYFQRKNLYQSILQQLKQNPQTIIKLGKTILNTSIDYFYRAQITKQD